MMFGFSAPRAQPEAMTATRILMAVVFDFIYISMVVLSQWRLWA